MVRRILIRADDLGYSRAVNYGIYDSVHSGIINNVGVMVNMPFTEHGLELLKDEDIDIGLHTDVSNGRPISDPNKIPSMVDAQGKFISSKVYRKNYGKPDFVNLNDAVTEVEAQYKRFLELVGKQPTYFEGHAVMSDSFIKALHIVGEKYDLPVLDFKFEGNKPVKFKEKTQFKFYMNSMKPNYDPRAELKEAIEHSEDRVIPMIVCHPGYLDQYILNTSSLTIPRTQEVKMAMDPEVKRQIQLEGIHLLRYSECN